jgi:hypothetical protein
MNDCFDQEFCGVSASATRCVGHGYTVINLSTVGSF